MSTYAITGLRAREVLSGGPEPTIEVELCTAGGLSATASVPRGSSKGAHEACDLRDGGTRYGGAGVRRAAALVYEVISPRLQGLDVRQQRAIDTALLELDGTADKSRLGGNTTLAVSLAAAKAGALASGLPLFKYIGGVNTYRLTAPMMNVVHGGKFAATTLDFEDHLLIPTRFATAADAICACVEVYRQLGADLERRFGSVGLCAGAYAAPFRTSADAFAAILDTVARCGYAGQFELGLDVAASLFYDGASDRYRVAGDVLTRDGLLKLYVELTHQFPALTYLEDPFHEEDFEGFRLLRDQVAARVIGDDLYVSSVTRLRRGIAEGAGNGVLLKVNQVGTLTEALEAARLATAHGFEVAVSVRSVESLDDWAVDVAVGVGARRIKIGAPSRGERNLKYNRLLRIAEELGAEAVYAYAEGPGTSGAEPGGLQS
jgi:enolase